MDAGRKTRRDRLQLFLAWNQGLDELYTRILDEHFGEDSPEDLEKLKLVLGLILGAEEPISLRTISELIPRDLSDPDPAKNLRRLQRMVRHLASLLVNTHDVDQPISPLHTSFADFLRMNGIINILLMSRRQTNTWRLAALKSWSASFDSTFVKYPRPTRPTRTLRISMF